MLRTKGHRRGSTSWLLATCGLLATTLVGCEVDSYMNPSVIGRWERTPVVMPILDQLDIIDEPNWEPPGLSQVRPEDLIPKIAEYVIGPGDVVAVSVFELMQPGQEFNIARRVDAFGKGRFPIIGSVMMKGQTEPQLEQEIADIVDRKGLLKDATVTVIVQQKTQATYSVMGEPRTSGTVIGTFNILSHDFRLLDAIALARGTSGRVKRLFVIRQSQKVEPLVVGPTTDALDTAQERKVMEDPDLLLEMALDSSGASSSSPAGPGPAGAGPGAGSQPTNSGQWVYADDKWVRTGTLPTQPGGDASSSELAATTQRVIEIPYDKLLEGDLRYNIVIRPGDIIRVPSPNIGNVFIMGAVNRPGTFGLPGDEDFTLQRLIAAAGGLNQLAWPERVDLIRMVGENQQATVRLNIKSIFEGRQPDFLLKQNDLINIGQSLVTTPLAVIRNGFRTTYGFGFVLDRNFGVDVFSHLVDNARR